MFPLENKTLTLKLIYYVALANNNIKRSELAMPKYGKTFLAPIAVIPLLMKYALKLPGKSWKPQTWFVSHCQCRGKLNVCY